VLTYEVGRNLAREYALGGYTRKGISEDDQKINSLGVERSGFRKGEVKMLYPFGSRIFLPGRKDTGKVCKVYRKSGSQFCKFVNMTMLQNCAVAGRG